jgi:hypothetical protein
MRSLLIQCKLQAYPYIDVDKPQSDSDFGFSVAITGKYVVVGEPNTLVDDAFVYNLNTGSLLSILTIHQNGQMVPSFGFSISLSGNKIVIGAPLEEDQTAVYEQVGEAYLFIE